jgi:hypothetical protein
MPVLCFYVSSLECAVMVSTSFFLYRKAKALPLNPCRKALGKQVFLCSLALALCCYSGLGFPAKGWAKQQMVNWQALKLDDNQALEIRALEQDWRSTYDQVSPQISKDKQRLMQLMKTPNANETEMMQVQSRLHQNESVLRQKATSVMMQKRHVLNENQMKRYVEFIDHAKGN